MSGYPPPPINGYQYPPPPYSYPPQPAYPLPPQQPYQVYQQPHQVYQQPYGGYPPVVPPQLQQPPRNHHMGLNHNMAMGLAIGVTAPVVANVIIHEIYGNHSVNGPGYAPGHDGYDAGNGSGYDGSGGLW